MKARPGTKVELQPGGRGDFKVTADGTLLWDKRAQPDDGFPDPADILGKLAKA